MSSDKERAKTIELAEKHLKKGKLQEAISEYRKLITGSAQDINFRNIISDLYLKLNKKAKAIEELNIIAGFYDERGLYSQSMAVYKKINKLDPKNIEASKKLADLYFNQGYLSEAKAEYLKVGEELKKDNRGKEAIALYDKILKLDKRDVQVKLALADLYLEERTIDQAVELFNEVAEFKIRSNALKEAHEVLTRARKIKEDHWRTLSNLIDLLKKEEKKDEAFSLLNNILKKDGKNIKALKMLGDIYFEDQDYKKAEETLSKIISLRPKDVDARVKLGKIDILHGNFDHAFELFDPLVEILIKKQKIGKVVGLLGLILSSKEVHLRTLEKLASVYKLSNQKENREVACRVLLEEYYKRDMLNEALSVLTELVELYPQDKELNYEYKRLKEGIGLLKEKAKEKERAREAKEVEVPSKAEKKAAEPALQRERPEELIFKEEEAMKKEEEAEIPIAEAKEPEIPAVEERRAERPGVEEKEVREIVREEIKEGVKEEKEPGAFHGMEIRMEEPAPKEEEKEEIEAPSRPTVAQKPTEFEEGSPEMLEMNLAQADLYLEQGLIRSARRILENLRFHFPEEPRIGAKLEAIKDMVTGVKVDEILERVEKVAKRETKLFKKKGEPAKEEEEEKISVTDILTEMDISPVVFAGDGKKYYDSTERIEEELEAMSTIFNLQLKGSTTTVEKDLSDIVAEFKKGLEKSIDKKDHESHFNLGIAFLEQDLLDDAIEEFKLASMDDSPSMECYSLISNCYRKKKNIQEAVNWLEKALKLCEEGSSQYLALKYELALCYEDLKEMDKALAIYDEIKNWDPEFRDVVKKIRTLVKNL
jgi:tetratricopeptide (TPR) repeat protein